MVLVSHRYKFIFLKTKKTGSTSVDAFFEKFCVSENDEKHFKIQHGAKQKVSEYGIVGSRFNQGKSSDEWRNHKPAAVVKDLLGDTLFHTYHKFSIVRNPWDKAVSIYHYHNGHRHGSFVEFIQKGMLQKLSTVQRGKHSIDWYIHSLNGTPICDTYLRFENLRDDVERLCIKLGIQNYNINDFPHFKKSSSRNHYSNYYKVDGVLDRNAVETVRQFYANEVEKFNYVFEET